MLTPYQDRKMKNLTSIYTSDDFRSKKNRRKKLKKNFKTNVRQLVPKTTVLKKEEGATVGVCRPFCSLPFLSGLTRLSFVGQNGQIRNPNHREILIKYQKRPTIVSSRRPSFQNSTDWPSKTDETNTKRCRMSLRKQTNNTLM